MKHRKVRSAKRSVRPAVKRRAADPKRVFVLYGRNREAAEATRQFLSALGLQSTDFDEIKRRIDGSPSIRQVVHLGVAEATAVIALFTPDEQATLDEYFERVGDQPEQLQRWQARPNVIFQAGLALGIDESKTIFVALGSDVSLFSDEGNRSVVGMDNSTQKRHELRALLETAGCAIAEDGDWLHQGDFETCIDRFATVATQAPPTVAPSEKRCRDPD
jgi:predicted nucleotide-binding protein